jgi:GAF domain-containing protein
MVHALPLRLRENTIGAMNIFDTELRELTPQELNLAQALADAATIGILQERAINHGAQLARQLQAALNSRIVIEQAKGVVAERLQLGMDEGFALIRAYARNHRVRLSEVAASVVVGSLPATDLSSTAPLRSSHRGSEDRQSDST